MCYWTFWRIEFTNCRRKKIPVCPILKNSFPTWKKITNILSAIEQGAFSEAINERLSSLEKAKKDIETAIIQEQIKRPFLTKEQIRFGIEKFKTLDIDTQDGRQRLIDGFINAVYLYDDKITIIFNYKDSTTTVSIDEYKSSDNKTKTAPKRETHPSGAFFFLEYWVITDESRGTSCPLRKALTMPFRDEMSKRISPAFAVTERKDNRTLREKVREWERAHCLTGGGNGKLDGKGGNW